MDSPKRLKFTLPFAPVPNLETMTSKTGVSYTPGKKKEYMKLCAETMVNFKGRFAGVRFVRLTILFICDRPQVCPKGIPSALWKSNSIQLYKPTRPDADNYVKPLQDSMSHHVIESKKDKHKQVIKLIRGACIVDDDAVFVSLRVDKVFRKLDQEPQIKIKLEEINYIYEPEPTTKPSRGNIQGECNFSLV